MNFIKLYNYIFSLIQYPAKNWNASNYNNNFDKKSFIIVAVLTVFMLCFSFIISNFSITDGENNNNYASIVLKIFCQTLLYILHFILVSFTIQKLLPYFNLLKLEKKTLFLIVYSTLFILYFFIILKNIFPELIILGFFPLYGFYVLFCISKNYLKIIHNKLNTFFIVISLLIAGYYIILLTILYYLFK